MVNDQQGWTVGWMLLMEDSVGARLSEYAYYVIIYYILYIMYICLPILPVFMYQL